LDAGYYQCLSNKINEILDTVPSDLVLDAGCGEGYYTNRMAKNRSVLGIDLSKDGVDYAARRAKLNDTGAGFAVASVFEMPIKDAALDAVVNIFAPCAEPEYSRVLRNGGHLLVVSAGE
jgi:23S rRNA (guanine745-N1)-methyltransferase